MKRIVLGVLFVSIMMSLSAQAAEQDLDRPHWSLELKGGIFVPAIENWGTYYGRRDTSEYGGSLAYKIIRQIEVGLEGSYIRDEGRGFAPGHGSVTGNVTYELAPLNVFVLARGVFRENQVLIPYAGGGWTRMYYREKIEAQSTIRGSADGYHGRAGLQFLLDAVDPRAAHNLYSDYGIHHTYLFGEVQVTKVNVGTPSINIGGKSYLAGLLFEF